MGTVNKINVNGQVVDISNSGIEIPDNITANDISYDNSFQYDENTIGNELNQLTENIEVDSEASVQEEITITSNDGSEICLKINKDGIYSNGYYDLNGDSVLSNSNDEFIPTIVCADVIIAVEGDTLQIFKRSLLNTHNLSKYPIEFLCSVGDNYPRYYEFKPSSSHIGNTYTLTINVLSDNNEIIQTKKVSIKVVSKLNNPSSKKNILIVGASAYANGNTTYELKRRLCDTDGDGTDLNPIGLGLSNFNFIGRLTGSLYKDIKQEATGGYGWNTYSTSTLKAYRFFIPGTSKLYINSRYRIEGVNTSSTYPLIVQEINISEEYDKSNVRFSVYGGAIYNNIPSSGKFILVSGQGDEEINYTSFVDSSDNPFWNNDTNSLDFKNYSTNYCNGENIDIIVCQFGLNDMSRNEKAIIDNITKFCQQFHIDYPRGIVLLGTLYLPSMYGGMGYNYHCNNNYEKQMIRQQQHSLALYEFIKQEEFSSYCFMIPCCEEFDNETSYPYKQKPTNNRSLVTEKFEINGVHPLGTQSLSDGSTGAYQVADAIYRTISGLTF